MNRLRKIQIDVLFDLFHQFRVYERADPYEGREDMELEVEPLPFPGEPEDARYLLDLGTHPAIREVRAGLTKGVTHDIGTGAVSRWSSLAFFLSWRGPGFEPAWEAMRTAWPDEVARFTLLEEREKRITEILMRYSPEDLKREGELIKSAIAAFWEIETNKDKT
jgi:hypothetical protein